MIKKRNVFYGNRITVFSLILIAVMALFVKLTVPVNTDIVPTEKIVYLNREYNYIETIKASPFSFVKGKEGSREGLRVLLMRKDRKKEIPEEIYVYIGNKKYLKYVLNY